MTETTIPRVDAKLQVAYERLAMLHSETLLQLNQVKEQLTQLQLQNAEHRCWWCSLKKALS